MGFLMGRPLPACGHPDMPGNGPDLPDRISPRMAEGEVASGDLPKIWAPHPSRQRVTGSWPAIRVAAPLAVKTRKARPGHPLRACGGVAGAGPRCLAAGPAGPAAVALPQAATGFDRVPTARVMRAEIGAKAASTSFSEASCSFAVSAKVRSTAVRV